MTNDIVDLTGDDDDYQVTLPVPKADFADFLGGIIGGNDKITHDINSPVHIGADTLRGLVGAIVDRVENQNHGKLASSRFEIKFWDEKGYRTNDIEKLLSISPSIDAPTRFLSIQLVFLIKYPNNSTPAREKVTIVLGSDAHRRFQRGVFSGLDLSAEYASSIEIEYVNRSWAEDTLGTIRSIIERTSKTIPKFRGLRWYQHPEVGVGAIFFSIAVFLAVSYFFIGQTSLLSSIDEVSPDIAGITEYLEQSRAWNQPHLVVIRGLFYVLIGGALVTINTMWFMQPRRSLRPLSFELFESDRQLHQEMAVKKERQKWRFILGFAVSVVSSLAAAYIYDALFLPN